ncbi:MAG TPA: two-component regulator propeller domain-containing protein, partial [Pyrinomonadaceae bacterium]|nr:two-component regulator propeller domain-containing protein [Pyrinomonadaceae bacterium]
MLYLFLSSRRTIFVINVRRMMMRLEKYAVYLLTFVSLCTLAASGIDAARLPIRNYTSADGLGSSFVNSLMRDSRGFLWICTRDGLSRFDGARFVTYQVGDKNAPPGIETILETHQGIYWIVTTGGLYRFDPRTLPAEVSSTERPRLSAELVSEDRYILFEDHNGDLWGGLNNGVYRIQDDAGKISFHKIALQTGRDLTVSSFCESRDGSLWIGSNSTVVRRLGDGREFYYHFTIPRQDVVTQMLEDREGTIWVGRASGVYAIKPESTAEISSGRVPAIRKFDELSKVQPATQTPVVAPARPGEIFRYAFFTDLLHSKTFYQTSDGRLLISDGSTIASFDGKEFEVLDSGPGGQKVASGMAEDASGNLWLAGPTGLMRLDRHGLVSYGPADGLKSPGVLALGETRSGNLYIAGDNFSLSTFDGRFFRTIRLPVPVTANALWTSNSVFQDREGEWWVLTNIGLYHFGATNDVAALDQRHLLRTYTRRDGLNGDQLFHIFEDSKGTLWISARDQDVARWGISTWDRATGSFHTFSEADGFPSRKAVATFAEDQTGAIWLGLLDGEVLRYAQGHFSEVAAGLAPSLVTAMHADRQGRIWIASSQSGITIVNDPNAAQPHFKHLTISEGLASNNIRALAEDSYGNVYLGTARGVDRVSPDLTRLTHYSIANGLAGDFIIAAFRDSRGTLWFGTPSGLSRLVPEERTDETPPPIRLSGLRVAGESRPIAELGSVQISDLQLNHNQNNLQIDFFAIDFDTGEDLRYQYQLEGADKQWSAPTTQHTVNYSNLAPGSYRFMVRAINSAGVYSPEPAIVSFRILPPIWRRWWFIALVVLLVAAMVFALDRYRVTRMRMLNTLNRRLKLEYEITRRLGESSSTLEAAPGILQAICEALDWDVGVIWDVDRHATLLRCVAVWHQPAMQATEFEAQTRARTFAPGEGLPGRVWATATPLWIRNLTEDQNFPRLTFAAREGLRSGFSFPILLGTEVIGIIEFFRRRITDRDERVEEMIQPIGAEIGQLLVRKQNEQALRESETRFRTLADTASDAIITIDANSTIIYINRAAENIFGYPVSEMLGQDLTMLMPEYLRHVHRAGLGRYVETGKRHISWSAVELPGLRKDGKEIPLELSFGEFTRNGQRYFTGIARDETERKRAAEELLRTREARAIELERVRKRIASDLHDDIGSSLTQISLLSEVVNQRIAGREGAVAQPLAQIANCSRELVDAMSDIVWAINPQKDHLSDLTQRMRTLTSEVSTACDLNVRFRAPEVDEDLPLGANLRREVFLIFKESINNIVKHSGATEAEVEFRFNRDQLFLRVSDNGQGFDLAEESEGHGLASMQNRAKD